MNEQLLRSWIRNSLLLERKAYNAGDVAEGIMAAAFAAKFMARPANAGDPYPDVTTQDAQDMLSNLSMNTSGKVHQGSFSASMDSPVGSPSEGNQDSLTLNIALSKNNMEALINPELWSDMSGLFSSAISYVNSSDITHFVERVALRGYASGGDPRVEGDEIILSAIGPLDQSGTKADFKISINGTEVLPTSLKAGGTQQLGQVGGTDIENINAYFSNLGINLSGAKAAFTAKLGEIPPDVLSKKTFTTREDPLLNEYFQTLKDAGSIIASELQSQLSAKISAASDPESLKAFLTNIGNLVQQASTSNDDSVEVTKLKGDKSGGYGRYRFDDRFIKNLASTQNLEVSRPKPDVVSISGPDGELFRVRFKFERPSGGKGENKRYGIYMRTYVESAEGILQMAKIRSESILRQFIVEAIRRVQNDGSGKVEAMADELVMLRAGENTLAGDLGEDLAAEVFSGGNLNDVAANFPFADVVVGDEYYSVKTSAALGDEGMSNSTVHIKRGKVFPMETMVNKHLLDDVKSEVDGNDKLTITMGIITIKSFRGRKTKEDKEPAINVMLKKFSGPVVFNAIRDESNEIIKFELQDREVFAQYASLRTLSGAQILFPNKEEVVIPTSISVNDIDNMSQEEYADTYGQAGTRTNVSSDIDTQKISGTSERTRRQALRKDLKDFMLRLDNDALENMMNYAKKELGLDEGKKRRVISINEYRAVLRDAILKEELSGADRKEIDKLIKKGIERDRAEQKRIMKKEIEAELKTSLGKSFFGNPGKVRKAIEEIARDELSREMRPGSDMEKSVVEITKKVLASWHEMLYKQQNIINRIRIK